MSLLNRDNESLAAAVNANVMLSCPGPRKLMAVAVAPSDRPKVVVTSYYHGASEWAPSGNPGATSPVK